MGRLSVPRPRASGSQGRVCFYLCDIFTPYQTPTETQEGAAPSQNLDRRRRGLGLQLRLGRQHRAGGSESEPQLTSKGTCPLGLDAPTRSDIRPLNGAAGKSEDSDRPTLISGFGRFLILGGRCTQKGSAEPKWGPSEPD